VTPSVAGARRQPGGVRIVTVTPSWLPRVTLCPGPQGPGQCHRRDSATSQAHVPQFAPRRKTFLPFTLILFLKPASSLTIVGCIFVYVCNLLQFDFYNAKSAPMVSAADDGLYLFNFTLMLTSELIRLFWQKSFLHKLRRNAKLCSNRQSSPFLLPPVEETLQK
jgi:hypothetical protein